jgi:hypothetical protein
MRFSVEQWVPFKMPTNIDLLDQEIIMPVSRGKPSPGSATGTITVSGEKDALLFEAPDAQSRRVGVAPPGASFTIDRRFGEFFRIALGKGRHAWISEKRSVPGGNGRSVHVSTPATLPRIEVNDGFSRVVPSDSEQIRITGSAEHPGGVRDIIVFSGGNKILYRPSEGPRNKLDFGVDVPLTAGMNQIQIIARHDDRTHAVRTLSIRRTAASPEK